MEALQVAQRHVGVRVALGGTLREQLASGVQRGASALRQRIVVASEQALLRGVKECVAENQLASAGVLHPQI